MHEQRPTTIVTERPATPELHTPEATPAQPLRFGLQSAVAGLRRLVHRRQPANKGTNIHMSAAESTPDEVIASGNQSGDSGITKPEAKQPIAEIARTVRALLSENNIRAEQTRLRDSLPDQKPPANTDDEKGYYRTQHLLERTQWGPRPTLCLSANNPNAQRITDDLANGPVMEQPGTWFPFRLGETQPQLIVKLVDKQGGIAIPTRNVVAASGFDSWMGRGYEGRGDKESEYDLTMRTSAETIALYAEREPLPVDEVTGYVQPNGLTFYTVGEGSHRAGAAVRRGDQTLQVTGELRLYAIENDFFELPHLESPSLEASSPMA